MIGSPRGRRALLAALVVLGLAPRGRGDGAGFVDVLPAGQERLFAEMLGEGAALPGGCAFDGAALDRTFVRARYRCAAGSVEIELRHPGDAAAAGAKRTTREFAIVARGDAPPSLLDGIEERVRGRERAFHWASAEAAGVGTVAADGGAGGSDTAALDEPQAARYRDALVLYRAGKVREALAALVALARENPHGGVLGTLLAALASSAPDGAELSSLVAAADAH